MPAEYVPYGVEWERELMKWRKGDLIGLLRQALTKEEKFTSTNSAMDAIAERYINEVEFLDSQDAGVVRAFVAHLQQQHQ